MTGITSTHLHGCIDALMEVCDRAIVSHKNVNVVHAIQFRINPTDSFGIWPAFAQCDPRLNSLGGQRCRADDAQRRRARALLFGQREEASALLFASERSDRHDQVVLRQGRRDRFAHRGVGVRDGLAGEIARRRPRGSA